MKRDFALFLRSAALFAALYQFRLIAGDLADTAVFAAAVLGAFAAAVFLASVRVGGRRAGALAVLAAIALIPWLARAVVALPRLLFPGRADALAATLDSLLLNFDRNNVVSLLPFYWAAATTWFAIRSRQFLRAATIADAVVLVLAFSVARTADIAMYRWPVVMIAVFAGIAFLQAAALLFSMPPEFRLRKRETIPAVAVLLVLAVIGGLLFLKPSQERAAEKGGGLLQPKLFSFDFSQFLRLDSEISMSDDLILIVKKDNNTALDLLRRSVLSGYSKKQGFYRIEELDERSHAQRLPERPVRFSLPQIKSTQSISQEYFLVNFDAAAFVGMKEPAAVVPYESWDSSSFKSAYAVESMASIASEAELFIATGNWPDAAALGLSESEFKTYTEYGGDERIRFLADEITKNVDNYAEKVGVVNDFLKYGEYRYSLKPGIAPDGDQLAWFLFNSKKGYCSYYAFAMTLMLRSLGIPARVAAGFFVDASTNTFDYYPVRSDMAHAWVEVAFPGYGWIEFDPTTENLAEGEEFRFSAGVDPDLFERLMREILENRSRLRAKQGKDAEEPAEGGFSLAHSVQTLLKKTGVPILLIVLTITFLLARCRYYWAHLLCRQRRKKTVLLWKHCKQLMRFAGMGRDSGTPESEWAAHSERRVAGVYSMYQCAAAARFAPEYTDDDALAAGGVYRQVAAAYRSVVHPVRRLLAWVLPPLAIVAAKAQIVNDADNDSGKRKNGGGKTLAAVLLLSALLSASTAEAQDEPPPPSANELLDMAIDAEYAELWERAIDLLKQGGGEYPDDPRFPRKLGNLFFSRSLYGLAWDEYRKVESLRPYDSSNLLQLAHTAGYLNRDHVAVDYLERLLVISPDNREAISTLSWMYYKVHRSEDGERLLTSALERLGEDVNMSMTLGTIYSDLYRYDEGKFWYRKAIAQGMSLREWERPSFVSVAQYNLSLLESRFHYYDRSMDEANASIDSLNRSSGHLARGEMYLRRLDLGKSLADYEAAYEMDTSPLAKINLAQIYQISGRLEEARLYAEDCLKRGDHSWMLNFGIDPDRYRRDIHEILYKSYWGLAEAERFVPWGRSGEKIQSLFRAVSYRFRYMVHRKLYQKYSLAAGDAYGGGTAANGSTLEQYIQYYNAFETYPRRAVCYLERARDFEASVIPKSEPSYILELGVLQKNENDIVNALAALDPIWERDLISRCYQELAIRGRQGRLSAAEELFAMNRGALRQNGIRLPVNVNIIVNVANNINNGRAERIFRRALKKAGFVLPAKNIEDETGFNARFALNVIVNGGAASAGTPYSVYCELADTDGTEKTLRQSVPLRSLSAPDVYDCVRTLGRAAFTAE